MPRTPRSAGEVAITPRSAVCRTSRSAGGVAVYCTSWTLCTAEEMVYLARNFGKDNMGILNGIQEGF